MNIAKPEGLGRTETGKLTYMGIELPFGPWHDEPDHLNFEVDGRACIIHRGPLGALCGYVSVPPGHPWHGVHEPADARVHGGVTYSANCQGPICHIAKPGDPDDVWWIGFDCAHLGDVVPGMLAVNGRAPRGFGELGESYKTLAYVREEVEQLAAQAQAQASAVAP